MKTFLRLASIGLALSMLLAAPHPGWAEEQTPNVTWLERFIYDLYAGTAKLNQEEDVLQSEKRFWTHPGAGLKLLLKSIRARGLDSGVVQSEKVIPGARAKVELLLEDNGAEETYGVSVLEPKKKGVLCPAQPLG